MRILILLPFLASLLTAQSIGYLKGLKALVVDVKSTLKDGSFPFDDAAVKDSIELELRRNSIVVHEPSTPDPKFESGILLIMLACSTFSRDNFCSVQVEINRTLIVATPKQQIENDRTLAHMISFANGGVFFYPKRTLSLQEAKAHLEPYLLSVINSIQRANPKP